MLLKNLHCAALINSFILPFSILRITSGNYISLQKIKRSILPWEETNPPTHFGTPSTRSYVIFSATDFVHIGCKN